MTPVAYVLGTESFASQSTAFWGGTWDYSRSRSIAPPLGLFSMPDVSAVRAVGVRVVALPFAGWTLRRPLELMVEEDCEGWLLASSNDLMVHGDGTTVWDAVLDFLQCLAELYEIVEESAAAGDRFDREQLAYLQTYIEPKS